VRVRRTVHTDGIQYRIVHMPPIAQERCVLCSCASAQLQPCFLGASGIGGERRLRGGSGDGRSVRRALGNVVMAAPMASLDMGSINVEHQ
jgi:hypothetical protein